MNISFEDFCRFAFKTVPLPEEPSSSESTETPGVLAIVNSGKTVPLFAKFIDETGIVSYCESKIPLGGTLSRGNEISHIKPAQLTDEEMSKLELCIAKVIECVVKIPDYSPNSHHAYIKLDLGSEVVEEVVIPNVSPDLSLPCGKKIVVLPHLPKVSEFDCPVQVLCGVDASYHHFWQPFTPTNPWIAVGTRATFI